MEELLRIKKILCGFKEKNLLIARKFGEELIREF
jgi:hypothetical protein